MAQRWSLVQLVFIICFIATISGEFQGVLPQDCNFEPLPDTFNSLSYLDFHQEFHLHGVFYTKFDKIEDTILFNISSVSIFRIYVAPHEVDVDLWLYTGNGDDVTHSSLDAGTEEVIQIELDPGYYDLKLNYFGAMFGDYDSDGCDLLRVEASIVPRDRVIARTSQIQCPDGDVVPEITSSSLQDIESFNYSSDALFASNPKNASNDLPWSVRMLAGYNFTLNIIKGYAALWEIEAVVGYDFITAGSIGVLIQGHDEYYDPNVSPDVACYGNPSCVYGHGRKYNEYSIRTKIGPGNYTLWLFDHYGERDLSLSNCAAFSFSWTIQVLELQETFMSCTAISLPDSLIPGLYDNPTGFVHYAENVLLNLDAGGKTMPFTITSPSYFKIFVAPHRIDIDLKLYDSTNRLIEYSLNWKGEPDAIVAYLQPGGYNVSIIYTPPYTARFCETFYLEVAIAPVSVYAGATCGADTEILPDLTMLSSAIQDGGNFSLANQGPYYHLYPGNTTRDFSQKAFYTQNFTVTLTSTLSTRIGKSFLLGDATITLIRYDSNGGATYHGAYERNSVSLIAPLIPGLYSFVISTGVVQSSLQAADLSDKFPNCLAFNLEFQITPIQTSSPCLQYNRVPKSLNTPQYLNGGNVVHFDKDFLVPLNLAAGQFSNEEDMTFSVTQQSLFRIWVEPHHIDVDLYLYDTASEVASTYKWNNNEEELIYVLQPNMTYTLSINYYHYRHTDSHIVDPACLLYHMELGITPLNMSATQPCVNTLPPSDLIPSTYEDSNFFAHNGYTFMQSSTRLSIRMPFTATDFIYFRAEITYDFMWSDLTLVLVANNQSSTYSEAFYNREDLSTLLLAPGYYTLEIHEPERAVESLRQCVSFVLNVGWELQNGPANEEDYQGCYDTPFPATFSSLSYLSLETAYKFHTFRPYLVDVTARKQDIPFTITNSSLLNMFVPFQDEVDVDLILKNSAGTTLVASRGFEEETITAKLDAGSYLLQVRYYPYYSTTLPDVTDCVAIPAELAIAPLGVLPSSLNQPCPTTMPGSTLQLNALTSGTFTRNLSAPFTSFSKFTISGPSQFDFDLRYNFLTGGLFVTLVGLVDEGRVKPVNRTFQASYGAGHAWFHRALQKGDYTLVIEDIYDHPASLQCSSFGITYYINTTGVTNFCDDTDVLPSDLYSAEGGSDEYGGPQDLTDGSVRIFGDSFYLNTNEGKNRHNLVFFKILQPSFVRIFLSTPGESDDIDFYVYKNATRSITNIVTSSLGTETVETKVFRLEPKDEPYLLDVYFFSIASKPQDCATFHFEMAIKPVTTVQNELLCPNPLPSPEVPPTLWDGSAVIWNDQDYIFSDTRIEGNTNREDIFTYQMTVRTYTNTSIVASIGYDFLANNFGLEFLNATNGRQIALGESDGTDSVDDYVNFQNILYAVVPAGTYYLNIYEDVSDKDWGFTTYCHRFEFFFALFPSSTILNNATIMSVRPSSGTNLNPYRDLSITITFSAGVSIPSSTNLLSYINDNNVIYMYDTTDSSTFISPSAANFDASKTTLTLVFVAANFETARTYRLMIDNTYLQTSSGVTFTYDDWPPHMYSMSDCQCGGHGHCSANSVACVCDNGYAGEDCTSCANGYHFAGVACVPNVLCTNFTCNGNGDCDDSAGYPICNCYLGYATTDDDFCSVCAVGWTGYPNCTRIGGSQRSDRCVAPLLPKTFDSVGFLGYNGHMHLSDNYFIDYSNLKHETYFSLQTDSYLRVYVEPHRIDIDVWLYTVDEDGNTVKALDYGITTGQEEVIFRRLNGTAGDHPNRYMLRFRYFANRAKDLTDCETMGLELAIAPVSALTTLAQNMAADCAATNQLPQLPGANGDSYQVIPPNATVYSPTTAFSVLARTNPTPGAYYFHHINFHISNPVGKMALLEVEIGYRFLPGSLALMLEAGNASAHCGSKGLGANCQIGSNSINRNSLRKLLPDGDYTLWIYEPEPQDKSLTTCSPFTFSFSVTYEDLMEDIYYCDGTILPTSLNDMGYLDSTGYVHISDRFLVTNTTQIDFTLKETSFFRISGKTGSTLTAFQLLGASLNSGSYYGFETELFATLNAGTYTLVVETFFTEGRCPIINIEFFIMPVARNLSNNCGSQDSLPNLGTIRPPFKFPNPEQPTPTSYFGFMNNEVLRQYTFTIDKTSVLEVFLDSDFLTSALKVVLESDTTGFQKKSGTYQYHRSYMYETIQPGTYRLKIVRPSTPSLRPPSFPQCAEFNFAMSLQLQTTIAQYQCSIQGEPLPVTFNSMRFLGNLGRFDYQGDMIRVPQFTGFQYKYITFTVQQPSFFRAYTEPHLVDIDISLFEEGTADAVADGAYTLNEEESFVYLLKPNLQYHMELIFWKWGTNIPACSYFNMEVAVEPVVLLPDTCPNSGADHWPPSPPTTVTLPYYYNSMEIMENLYYQQQINVTRSYSMNFKLTSTSKLYSLLKYDFATGDLVLNLFDGQTTYWGDNLLDGDVLRLTGLAPGSYVLTIYEATFNVPDYMGCSPFDFILSIEADTPRRVDAYHYLPATFDSIPFLTYASQVHLQGWFEVFADSATESVTFTLGANSLLRAVSSPADVGVSAIGVQVTQGANVISSGSGSLLTILTASSKPYTLQFTRPSGVIDGTIITNLEIAIESSNSITQDIAGFSAPAECSNTPFLSQIQPNPQTGAYGSHDEFQVSQQSMETSPTLGSVQIIFSQDSSFYVKAGFNFLLSDMMLTLTGVKDATGETITFVGRNGRNLNEINQIVPAGTYSLSVSQRSLFSYMSQFPHCTTYDLRMLIQDASSEDHVDCAEYDTLPWDLNSQTGGSVQYGGPMDGAGSIHIWGDQFLMPLVTSQIDTIQFTLQAKSLLSVVNTESYFGDISHRVRYGSGSIKALVPVKMSNSDTNQRAELFVLDGGIRPNNPVQFDLQLLYKASTTSVACPYFGLQIAIQSIAQVGRNLLCPVNLTSQLNVLPSKTVVTNSDGVYSEFVESSLTSPVLFGNGSTPFKYDITVFVNETSTIIASFSFNSLATNFKTELASWTRGYKVHMTWGEIRMQRTSFGVTNLNSLITGTLTKGKYVISITQPAATEIAFMNDGGRKHCYPFIYNLQVFPATGVPYVSSVEPPMGDQLSPLAPLEVEITFSNGIFYNNQPVSAAVIKQVFFLRADNGTTIAPTSVANSNKYWKLIFSSAFQSAATYTLGATPNTLTDSQGNYLAYTSVNRYRMIDTTCSGHGQFDRGYCFCFGGYAGIQCEVCDVGYIEDGGVCKQQYSNLCLQDSCGCVPGISPCKPKGVCNDTSGTIQCSCDFPWAGSVCDQCVAGYMNTAQGCVKIQQCPACVRGKCNEEKGVCECPGHWTGSVCDECESGWSGSDCETSGSQATNDENASKARALNAVNIFGTVLATLVIVATIAFFVYKRFAKKQSSYTAVFENLDTEETTHELRSVDDDDDEESIQQPKTSSLKSTNSDKPLVNLD